MKQMKPSNENVLKGIEAIASSALAGGAPVHIEMESREQACAVFGDFPGLSSIIDASPEDDGRGTVIFQSHSPMAWCAVVKIKPQEPATTYRDRMIAAAGGMHLLLEQAVRRVELAREDGDKILSAWLPEAKRILAKIGSVDDPDFPPMNQSATEQEDPERFDTSTM